MMIEVNNLTLTYPNQKGVFHLDFTVKKGEVIGYLGPNGAGKTTTIRQLVGFMKPDEGYCRIGGRDCFNDAPFIMKSLGYIPGEITFLENMSGEEYLTFISEIRGLKDTKKKQELMDLFELNPKGNIRKFSKGMKQKLGIVAAFMHDPEVLILDEPTSGLDPLMQNRFIELVLSEKKNGKTILMSSHMFEEVERTCDHVLIIKDGLIVANSDIKTLKSTQRKGFLIKSDDVIKDLQQLQNYGFNGTIQGDTIELYVTGDQMKQFVKLLCQLHVLDLDVKSQSLEDIFMHYYAKGV